MCDLCPIIATFDAAEKFIGEYSELHEDPQTNLGLIALNRACAERVQEAYSCPGPNLDSNGNIHCPLLAMFGDAFGMSAYRSHPGLMIPPEKVAGGETDTPTGQML